MAADRVRRAPEESWDVVRCRRCGFGWTEPLLGTEELSGYYPPTYLGTIDTRIGEFLEGKLQRSRSWRGETEKVRLVMRYVASGRVLDVGCGDGKFLWALPPDRYERAGIERSAKTVELVRRRMPDIDLVSGDIHSPELEPGRYDLITFWHVLEHLPRPDLVLERVGKLLRPGGWLIISLPCIDSLQASLFRSFWYGFDDVPRHLHHFSKASLNRLLENAGFLTVRHLLFSRLVNFHSLKHSLLNWSNERFHSRIPYYALKPALLGLEAFERVTGRYGIRTVIARKRQGTND
ncbi:MAG: class I SAM-dependent methyltransferase [Acidobacteria bacterium]|nr:class I SAM-dependent methyltransferase [Acidobacteriota bacterium]